MAWLFAGCAAAGTGTHLSGLGAAMRQGDESNQVTLDVDGCDRSVGCGYALKLEGVRFLSGDKGLKVQARILDGSVSQTFELDEVWRGHNDGEVTSLIDLSSLPLTQASRVIINFSEVDIRTGESTELRSITVGNATVVGLEAVQPQ